MAPGRKGTSTTCSRTATNGAGPFREQARPKDVGTLTTVKTPGRGHPRTRSASGLPPGTRPGGTVCEAPNGPRVEPERRRHALIGERARLWTPLSGQDGPQVQTRAHREGDDQGCPLETRGRLVPTGAKWASQGCPLTPSVEDSRGPSQNTAERQPAAGWRAPTTIGKVAGKKPREWWVGNKNEPRCASWFENSERRTSLCRLNERC